jgi:hypothetical protein
MPTLDLINQFDRLMQYLLGLSTDFEMRASLCRKQCVEQIVEFFCLAIATNPFRLPDVEGAPPVQILMYDSYDKS